MDVMDKSMHVSIVPEFFQGMIVMRRLEFASSYPAPGNEWIFNRGTKFSFKFGFSLSNGYVLASLQA